MTKIGKSLVCATFIGALTSVYYLSLSHQHAHNIYRGEVGEYAVEIVETDYGKGFERIVHLKEKGARSWAGITGHDYNDDGKWDRIFFCGSQKSFGCNSFHFILGQQIWEPCDVDKDRVQPLPLGDVIFAKQQLNAAMMTVHRAQFRTSEDWKKD